MQQNQPSTSLDAVADQTKNNKAKYSSDKNNDSTNSNKNNYNKNNSNNVNKKINCKFCKLSHEYRRCP